MKGVREAMDKRRKLFNRSGEAGMRRSYIDVARQQGNTYFDMEADSWKAALDYVGGNVDEMWRIKRQFVDDQAAQGKDFDLVDDPSPGSRDYVGFYRREVAYLRAIGYTVARKVECWHACR